MTLLRNIVLSCSLLVAILAFLFTVPALRDLLIQGSAIGRSVFPNFIHSKQAFSSSPSQTTTAARNETSSNMARMPTYFFSHGGPDVQYNTGHPVYPVLQKIGKEITSLKPKAVVVFSGHWQATPINVNTALMTELIYDFYGFPQHFYQAKYPNIGSPDLGNKILSLLSSAGIEAKGVKRGLDHGVWSGFNVAFDPDSNPLGCPLVQVSLFKSEDPVAHYALGRAVSSLRDEGVVIIGAGMSVHNLRDLRFSMGSSRPMPYSVSFDDALKEAALANPKEREQKMAAVTKRPDAKQAHPWMDHLMPVHVAAGAAEEEKGTQIWTLQEGSFAWAQYRFGEIPKEVQA